MLGEFKKKSLVGSWFETFTFMDGGIGRALTRTPEVGQMGGITGKQSARFLKNSQNPWVLFEILFLVRCVAARIHARFSPIRSPYVTCSPNEKVDAQRRVQVRGTQCNP